jgi:hypothetical protein
MIDVSNKVRKTKHFHRPHETPPTGVVSGLRLGAGTVHPRKEKKKYILYVSPKQDGAAG